MHSCIKGLGVMVELDVKDVKLVLHILHWFSNNHTCVDSTLIWMKITEFTSYMCHESWDTIILENTLYCNVCLILLGIDLRECSSYHGKALDCFFEH
jgi:hypothetical protein